MKNNNARGETNYAGYTALAQNEMQDPNAAKGKQMPWFPEAMVPIHKDTKT